MIKKLFRKILPKSVFEETKKLTNRIEFDEYPIEYIEIHEIIPPLKDRIKDFFWYPDGISALFFILWFIAVIVVFIIA